MNYGHSATFEGITVAFRWTQGAVSYFTIRKMQFMKQINRSSLKIILEASIMVLSILIGILLGDYMNKHVLNDGHTTNWTIVFIVTCALVVYVIIWAVVNIKKLDNKKDNQ